MAEVLAHRRALVELIRSATLRPASAAICAIVVVLAGSGHVAVVKLVGGVGPKQRGDLRCRRGLPFSGATSSTTLPRLRYRTRALAAPVASALGVDADEVTARRARSTRRICTGTRGVARQRSGSRRAGRCQTACRRVRIVPTGGLPGRRRGQRLPARARLADRKDLGRRAGAVRARGCSAAGAESRSSDHRRAARSRLSLRRRWFCRQAAGTRRCDGHRDRAEDLRVDGSEPISMASAAPPPIRRRRGGTANAPITVSDQRRAANHNAENAPANGASPSATHWPPRYSVTTSCP